MEWNEAHILEGVHLKSWSVLQINQTKQTCLMGLTQFVNLRYYGNLHAAKTLQDNRCIHRPRSVIYAEIPTNRCKLISLPYQYSKYMCSFSIKSHNLSVTSLIRVGICWVKLDFENFKSTIWLIVGFILSFSMVLSFWKIGLASILKTYFIQIYSNKLSN